MKKIINKIKKFFIMMTALIFVKPFLKKSKSEKAVAFVVYGGLGDGVLWLQYANDAIKHYEEKGYKVYLICNKSIELLYKNYTDFKEIIVVNNNIFESYKSLKNTLKSINIAYFEEVIDIRLTKHKYQDIYLIKNIKAKRKIGYNENDITQKNIKLQNKVFDELINVPNNEHEINSHYYFLKNIGIETKQNLFYLRDFVKSYNDENFITLCVGASDTKRIWNVNNWVDVIKYIIDNTNYKIYFCGSRQEGCIYDAIYEQLPNERLINKCGKTSLQELLDILGNSKFVIANDSGPGHIASCVGSKGIILLGGGFNFRFFPHKNSKGEKTNMDVICVHDKCWNCAWKCTKSNVDFPCIKQITSEMIKSKVSQMLN